MANLSSFLVIWLSVFSMSTNVVMCVVELDFRVTPAVITPLETANVTIQCLVTERTNYYNPQNSYYYNQYGQHVRATNPPPSANHKTFLAMIRILKNHQSTWEPIAQINYMSPTTVEQLDASITTSSGTITSNLVLRSYIQVNWQVATSDVFGTYRCDALSFDTSQNGILTTSSQLILGNTLNALDFLLLLKHDKREILDRIDVQEKAERSNYNQTKQLKADLVTLEESTQDKQIELEEKVKKQGELLQVMSVQMEKRTNDVQREITDRIEEIDLRVSSVLESGFLMLWPRGTYGLLQPKSACPFSGMTSWKSGWRRHHTESTDRNQDAVPIDNHLHQHVLERLRGKNFMTQHFCIKTDIHSVGPVWSKGSYCINKKGQCPSHFNAGYIRWDEEDDSSSLTHEGELPDGIYDDKNSTSTIIEYCCRKDGSADVPMFLPSSNPFYLYRYNGNCQQVYGMNVTEEFLLFDTENINNHDRIGDVHPDARINNVRLELCYYQSS